MVIDGVPDAAYGAPVMSFYSETAVRARLHSTAPLLVRSSVVLQNASLLRTALTQQAKYLKYDESLGVREINRREWITLHSAQIRAAGSEFRR